MSKSSHDDHAFPGKINFDDYDDDALPEGGFIAVLAVALFLSVAFVSFFAVVTS